MTDARFRKVDLSGARFDNVLLAGVVMRDVALFDVDISGELRNVTINGVDVAPLVEAELDPELLHESVGGEWSFVQTLRHLVFATDTWVHRVMLGDPTPWDPLDLPFDGMEEAPGVPWDRDVRPSLDEVRRLRAGRVATVRSVLDGLTAEQLDGHTEAVEGPGWPEPREYPVRECLLTVLNEEWQHRLYAERDLDALTPPEHSDPPG